ncbi:hypothetical protein V5D56_02600 [Cellulosimicrobium sp. PMB13]|uniref:hypothetical protein n=1 Tax=Cellulosimicrobium sp. PMB13 TaxID=3120158 RepID=UPI003F4B98F8
MTRTGATARPRSRHPASGQRRRRAVTTAALLVLGAGAAGGCASLWTGSEGVTVDEVAVWGESVGAGDAALLEGHLTVEGGCVYVTDGFGTRWLPVFSEDLVAWDGTALSGAGGSFVDGDAVALAGGVLVEDAPDGWEAPAGLHVPTTCDTADVWNATR